MSPAPDLPDTVAATRDKELDNLLASHPWLENLEPYCIDWELIWSM